MVLGEFGTLLHNTSDMPPRCNQVRFQVAFKRRSNRRESCEFVITGIIRSVTVCHRTNGHYVGHVARHTNAERIRTAVACRCDNHNACLPCLHDRYVDRVIPVVRLRRTRERQIEYANVVFILIFNDVRNAANHIHVSSVARVIKRSNHDQVGVGCNTVITPCFLTLTVDRGQRACDDARDMTAVT